jgi:hypothetical protein
MSSIARWQLVVHYLGEVLMFAGIAWGIYRMAVLHACPTAQFNDLTLISLGLGLAVLPLMPFTNRSQATSALPVSAPAYLAPMLQRHPPLAAGWWTVAVVGVGLAGYAQWSHWPGLIWFDALLPAVLYLMFGVNTAALTPASQRRGAAVKDSEVHRHA